MDFGTVVKKYRLEKNVTQEEMACALFVTPQAVSRWENGLSLPDITMIPKIVKYLGVSADILLGCNKTEQEPPPEAADGDLLCQDQIILIPDLRVDIFAEIPRLSLRQRSLRYIQYSGVAFSGERRGLTANLVYTPIVN